MGEKKEKKSKKDKKSRSKSPKKDKKEAVEEDANTEKEVKDEQVVESTTAAVVVGGEGEKKTTKKPKKNQKDKAAKAAKAAKELEDAEKEVEELEKQLEAAKLKVAQLREKERLRAEKIANKPPRNLKFYWTALEKRKDGKVLPDDNQIKIKASNQTHVWIKNEDDKVGQANSPFYFRKVTGDFIATVKVSSRMNYWLDQAGLLLRGKKMGLYTKVGLEYHDDPHKEGSFQYYAAAFVHPKNQLKLHSNQTPHPGQWRSKDKKYDYSMLEELDPTKKVDIWFRVTRTGNMIEAEYNLKNPGDDEESWVLLRESKFTKEKTLSVGVFAASGLPESEGVKVVFENLSIEEDSDWEDDDSDEEDTSDEEDSVLNRKSVVNFGTRMLANAEEELRKVEEAKEAELEALMARMKASTEENEQVFDIKKEVAGGRRSSMVDPATTPHKKLLSDSDDDSDDDSE